MSGAWNAALHDERAEGAEHVRRLQPRRVVVGQRVGSATAAMTARTVTGAMTAGGSGSATAILSRSTCNKDISL